MKKYWDTWEEVAVDRTNRAGGYTGGQGGQGNILQRPTRMPPLHLHSPRRPSALYPPAMVRIKYTGPQSALQTQSYRPATKPQATIQKRKQNEVVEQPQTTQEHLALKQQQSLEMVQIMLHVSVSTNLPLCV